jgi:hypothetical protein
MVVVPPPEKPSCRMPDGECQAATDRGFVLYIWLGLIAAPPEIVSERGLGQTGICDTR